VISPTDAERHLPLDGTRNLRDVGGYPAGPGRHTRWRTLLRSDELTRLPPGSIRRLHELGLRQVIDLRWPEELERSPNVFRDVPGVRYRSIPLLRDDPTPHDGLGGMYRHVFDRRASELATIVRALLEEDGLPAVIGCAAGKDRTGVTIALLLDVVGTPLDVIVTDYARSAHHFRTPVSRVDPDDWRHPPLEVDSSPELMASALDHLHHRHGGSWALLRGEGVTEHELRQLVNRLTESDPG
jgi:protein-tyrosine phosphatase